jgi:hypothetical protein
MKGRYTTMKDTYAIIPITLQIMLGVGHECALRPKKLMQKHPNERYNIAKIHGTATIVRLVIDFLIFSLRCSSMLLLQPIPALMTIVRMSWIYIAALMTFYTMFGCVLYWMMLSIL